VFGSFGYAPVATPPFELESVIARALEGVDQRELLRFVDAETGEVVMLRPDITPQIARVVASRLRDRPVPIRLSYEGHVVRRRRGRARTQRQIAQAGVECLGVADEHADLEVLELASRALRAAGLRAHRIELNLTPLAGALLDRVEPTLRHEARAALARKDRTELERLLHAASREVRMGMLAALELLGGVEVLARARRLFQDRPSRQRIDALGRIHRALEALDLGVPIGFDLGEPRGFGYYTGTSFAVLAEGPGEPVAVGGRYDELLARFGAPMPATGVAIDLDHLEWALGDARPREPGRGAVIAGDATPALLASIRSAGVAAVALPGASLSEAQAYALAWDHPTIVVVKRKSANVVSRDSGGATIALAALPAFLADEPSRTKR
jgi:ATP phosphoribosyltransferase regulatory subunit